VTPAAAVATGCLTALAGIASAAGVLHAREALEPSRVDQQRVLYLRAGKAAERAFLSFDALAADVYWLRTIQHYGRDRKSGRTTNRFELLQPLVDLTTTLDPRFNLAYRFGAIFLSMEPPNGPGRPDQAIALLEKGLAANPRRWQYAHDIGFIHYWHTGNFALAAAWFERSAAMPGAPEWIKPLAGLTLAQGGDREGARKLLTELLSSNESYIRNAAERSLAQLQTLDVIDAMQDRVAAFQTAKGRYPADWRELGMAAGLPGVPLDAAGVPLEYDVASHMVGVSRSSPLVPLPTTLARR
jgi:tetratricopeptide (TPR) repeat protein